MEYRREIDGLRALAVFPVILFHAGANIFKGGFVGVDIFFVISGYLITSIILAEIIAGTFSLVNFYERRIRRILPALFLVIFSCIPFAWLWLSPYDMNEFTRSIRFLAMFFSNILFYRESGYFDTESVLKPLLHTWTLSVEEQYYVIFPLFLMAVWRFAKHLFPYALVLIASASLLYAENIVRTNPSAAFFLLPSRMWEFMIGAFLAYLGVYKKIPPSRSQPLSFLGLAFLLYSIFQFSDKTPYPSFYAVIPTIGAALIIMFATKETVVGKTLGSPLFVGIGLISYSAYLWHQPVFALYRQQSINEPAVWDMALLTIATFIIAYLSWRFVEQPFRRKEFINRKKIFTLAFIGTMGLMALGYAGKETNGFAQRFSADVLDPISKAVESKRDRAKCWKILNTSATIASTCAIGNKSVPASFAIVGDSHAGSLSPSFDESSLKLGISGRDFTYGSCLFVLSDVDTNVNHANSVCEKFRSDFFSKLDTESVPDTLILLQRWSSAIEGDLFDNQEGGVEIAEFRSEHVKNGIDKKLIKMKLFKDSIQKLLANGKRVVVVYPVPEMGWNVTKRMLRLYSLNRKVAADDASTSYAVFKERNKNAYEMLDSIGEHRNLIRIYPEKIFCNTYIPQRCAAHVNGVPLYYDDDHLTKYGADLVMNDILSKLNW